MKLERFCVPVGGNEVRDSVIIETDKCAPNTHLARIYLAEIVNAWFHNLDLLQCGEKLPKTVLIKHDGAKWVLEAEAISEIQRG